MMMKPTLAGISLLATLILMHEAKGNVYDFDDPQAGHTNQAIAFDGDGDKLGSLRSFQSAVRFTPTSETYTNLGVCLMRMGTATPLSAFADKTAWYHKSHAAMNTGKTLAISEKEWGHVDENSKALKQSMNAEGIDEPPLKALDPLEPFEPPSKPSRPKLPGGTFTSKKGDQDRKKRKSQERAEAAPAVHREKLLHQRPVPLGVPFPRVSIEDLDGDDPQFELYRQRREPFILTGGMAGWKCLDEWPETWQKHLSELFPEAVTDFYPHNMLSTDRQNPYLTRLPRAVKEVMLEGSKAARTPLGSKFDHDGTAQAGRYMHLQLTPKMWMQLEERGDINALRHWHLSSDEWLEDCLGFPDSALAEEYHLKTHWKIILTGSRGAGMFNHSDSLQTSSWHSHIMGLKWWYVCGQLVNGTKGVCFEGYVEPGETLYYGTGWHHETQNIETPTMTITDTVAHEHNFGQIADQLYATCTHDKMRFGFSADLCDGLDGCFNKLHEMHTGKPKPAHMWRPWRTVAKESEIKNREKVLPAHNNYDGRNYITEL
eukprot:CAMPEP_0171931508 /NCGR_PEP_ID=MMETSP0993-20121228/29500_1 /TAXON_ID=483369 /ORGANISM="non described non described, Strain CCMP2098" /LENGTH=542 /DNA_ID=CAMNT_0012571555 /DNA_START=24 /DNA_END=1652 /DNA_ORIENTATION=-